MTLIKSISGIRGTIGGKVGEGLSPVDTVRFTAAYGTWIQNRCQKQSPTVVVGRDARISGDMIRQLVVSTLQALGIDVYDLVLMCSILFCVYLLFHCCIKMSCGFLVW